ncbi:hypothetical protein RSAG8_13135, partial [Rhizoctonia solani AG-8 WAC10335]
MPPHTNSNRTSLFSLHSLGSILSMFHLAFCSSNVALICLICHPPGSFRRRRPAPPSLSPWGRLFARILHARLFSSIAVAKVGKQRCALDTACQLTTKDIPELDCRLLSEITNDQVRFASRTRVDSIS